MSVKRVYNTLLFYVLLVLCACTDSFDEINKNPNNPTQVTPALLLAGIERDMMTTLVMETWEIGNAVIQHTAKNITTNTDRYIWGERNAIWNTVYDKLRDINYILEQTDTKKDSNYRAVALILRAWMFSLATDCYGDIPYSETMQGKEGILFPTYDPQEVIYEGILRDLAEANRLIQENQVSIDNDFIYKGDMKKWQKLANALRLRYLLRISGRKDVSSAMETILANSQENPLFESNADNATYSFSPNAPDQFPILALRVASFNEYRASQTLVNTLAAYNDPRLFVYFRPTPATETTANPSDDQYLGIPNGMTEVRAATYNGGPDFQSRVGPLFYEQSISEQGRQIARGILMTHAELQFILAEAAEKKLIHGNAEPYYLNGIHASFDYYQLQPDENYLSQTLVAYTGSTAEKTSKIMTQKWISLFFQGLEPWFDWRRTGHPKLKPGLDNQNANKIPVRFIYPLLEQSLNGQKQAEAVNRQGADNINTPVWWDTP
jgi:hypothetical protein